ncbi:MAG: hypothetical protein HQK49_05905 [Oligoflexia bacterium]|nr:hypothetical protein [Oligoflexia bacterium]
MGLKDFFVDFFFKKVPINENDRGDGRESNGEFGESSESCHSCGSGIGCGSGGENIGGVSGELPAIARLKPGGMYKIRNYGLDMEDVDVSVTKRNMYSEDSFCWFELQGDASNGKQIFLEIDMEDEIILEASIKRDLKLSELGISRNDLDRIRGQKQGEVRYMNMTFSLDAFAEATFYRDANLDYGRDFNYFDFYNDENKLKISIRVFDDSSDKIILSQSIRKEQVEILKES